LVERKLSRKRERGLTLVELLVVIVILALASSVVMLNAPPVRPEARDDAERFAARMQLALDEATTSGAVMRVSIDALGYDFETMKDGKWTATEDKTPLSRSLFNKRTTATVETTDAANDNARALGSEERVVAADEGEAEDEDVRFIALDPLGAQTAFSVNFSGPQGAWIVTVSEGAAIAVRQDV
jgi:general secretion pathway protein H